jgi:hypothetical protein
VLQDVIEGPLLNHKRMEEAIKVSKFMRKLMSFFHPFNHRFADMPRRVRYFTDIADHRSLNSAQGNMRWAKLANSLLNTLLASPEGQRYLLNEDPLVKDIVRGFAQLDPVGNMLRSHHRQLMDASSTIQQRSRTRYSPREEWKRPCLTATSRCLAL